jgi:ABC-type glycerol-3-phosphate transport system substrate-binding protein
LKNSGKDLFAEKGIDIPTLDSLWTLDDLIRVGKELDDPSRGIKGLWISNLSWAMRFFNDSWATKIDVSPLVIEGGKYSLNLDGEYRALFERMQAWGKEGIVENGEGGYDPDGAFNDGLLAIYVGAGCFKRSVYINEYQGKVNWGMLPPVKIKTTSTYGAIQTVSIPEKSKNKEAAMEFLKFFWNVDNQERIAQAAYIFPGRNSAIERFNKLEDGWDLAYESAKNLIVPNYIPVPGWGTFSETTGKTIYQEYMIGQIDYETFKKRLNDQLLPFLEEVRQE